MHTFGLNLKVTLFLMCLITFIVKSRGSLFQQIERICQVKSSSHPLPNRVLLLNHIIENRIKENIIVVTDDEEWDQILEFNSDEFTNQTSKIFTVTRLQPHKVNKERIQSLASVYLKDNKPPFYILYNYEESTVLKIMATIREVDSEAKVVIIYNGTDNVRELWADNNYI